MNLKRILVIDNRELYPTAGAYADIVDERPSLNVDDIDPADYGAIFVHDANEDELNWTRSHRHEYFEGIYFKFTGEGGEGATVSENRGAYKLPRWVLNKYFESFLAAYRNNGRVDRSVANIFWGK